jgi:hypothetical protein
MSIGLDVWIARPGSVCLVDDGTWKVTVYDAHGNVFQWAGATYANLAAPHAHWAGTIPPGTYVVRAVHEKTGVTTDRAIVTVEPMRASSVILFVGAGERRPPHRECKITIDKVAGDGDPVRRLHVEGTAQGCDGIELEVRCGGSQAVTQAAVEASGGHWTTIVSLSREECRCNRPISIVARCREHPECVARYENDRLRCREDKG